MKSSGSRTPRIELVELGPRADLTIRRHKLAADDLMKDAMRQPKTTKVPLLICSVQLCRICSH